MRRDEAILGELMDRWEQARRRGHPASLEELCADRPELLGELRRRVRLVESVQRKLDEADRQQAATQEDREPLPPPDPVTIQTAFVRPAYYTQGGLGTIYLATDEGLHRDVALKFIHQRLGHDAPSRDQFLQEAEITARLEHPGVVPLYGAGETEDRRLFYAMRFIQGETLEAAIDRYHRKRATLPEGVADLKFRSLLNRLVSVCNTVAYAHNRGIVHRDLKPGNVMLGRYGETLVLDWGLAVSVDRAEPFKVSEERTLRPKSGGSSGGSSGSGAGTAPFMSPAQTTGLPPSPADDIYALGVVLYDVLTGRLPFEGDELQQIRQQVLIGRFPRPSERGTAVPAPLEAICLKAMSYHPEDRYSTALVMAAELEKHLADEPVADYAEPYSARLARWARRHRAAAASALTGLILVALVTLAAALLLGGFAAREREARWEAERAREAVDAARRDVLRTSAQLTAQAVAQEIDLHWRTLEAEANSAPLRRMLDEANQDPGDAARREPLQEWLDQRAGSYAEAVPHAIWFINGRGGTQLARHPIRGSVGRNYAHRSYFTGLDHDLSAGTAAEPHRKPVHMSAIFESTNTRTLMVALSVPVWDAPPEAAAREPLGTFTLAVELGHFRLLPDAMIADLRIDHLEGVPRTGLVLHHHDLGPRSHDELPPRLDEAALAAASQARALRRSDNRQQPALLIEPFHDPLDPQRRPLLAAIDAVQLAGRGPDGDTGWVVVVVEPAVGG